MKTCNDCQLTLPYDNFHRKSHLPDGRSHYCKDCTAKRAKKYYNNSPGVKEKVINRNKKFNLEKRTYVLEYLLSYPCVDCGENRPECLDFDHQKNKIMNVSEMIHRHWGINTIKKEIDKCEVRCANCHRVRTAKQFNWYSWYPRLDSNQH